MSDSAQLVQAEDNKKCSESKVVQTSDPPASVPVHAHAVSVQSLCDSLGKSLETALATNPSIASVKQRIPSGGRGCYKTLE